MSAIPAPVALQPVPALRLARRFARLNRRRRFLDLDARTRLSIVAAVAASSIAIAFVGYRLSSEAAPLLDLLRTHLPVVALAAALSARSRVSRMRKVAMDRFSTSWLSVAPIEPRDVVAMIRRRVATAVVFVLAVASGVIGAAGLVDAIATGGIVVALVGGGVAGSLAGWWNGGRRAGVAAPTAVRIGRHGDVQDRVIRLTALGRWPFAERFANLRPQVDARVFGTALLSMPMGIPPFVAVLLLLLLVVVVMAATLLNAHRQVVPRAADWLRTTPLGLNDFLVSSSARVVAWQCVYVIATALLLAALGASASAIAATTAGWMAWVVVSASTAFACRHRPGRLRAELAVSSALLAVLAVVAFPIALTAAAAVAIVQWKRAASA